mgnify:CR=1 FL=1|jgi:hypothetical protein
MTREEIEAVVIDELEFLIKWEQELADDVKDKELLAALQLVRTQFGVKQ